MTARFKIPLMTLFLCFSFLPAANAGGRAPAENNISASAFRVLSSAEIIERAREIDGSVVMYQGEAVGEVMYRGESAWINVHDGDNAIGVWCEKAAAEQVRHCGSYHFSGDLCLVTGVFNRACPRHGGALDIHAEELVVLTRGEKTAHNITAEKKRLAVSAGIPGVLLAGYYFARRRTRKRV